MEKKIVLNKDWDRFVGNGKKTETIASCIDSLIKNKCSDNEWGEKTTEWYVMLFDQKILPYVTVANTKPINDYTADDIENAVYMIKLLVDDQEYDSVETHLRLLRFAIEEGIKNEWCDDTILYGTSLFHETETSTKKRKHPLGLLIKSLNPTEEITLFRYLKKHILANGEIMGLLLMLALGLRNNEACPLTWNKIQELETNPEIHILYIVESSKKKKTESKAGGKTKNAPRIIPIPKCVYMLLMKRKEWIRTYIQDHYDELILQYPRLKKLGIEKFIGKLRIVCHGDNIFSKTRPDDLTREGKIVLAKTVNYDSHSYYLLNEYLKQPGKRKELRDFRDPTCYVLRHNFASSLLATATASMSIIQYLMGHVIENRTDQRYDYSNADRQEQLYWLMESRPLFAYNAQRETIKCNTPYAHEKRSGNQEYIITRKPGQEIEIEIHAFEPNDSIHISIGCQSEINMTKKIFYGSCQNHTLVDNLENQYRAYRKADAALKDE